MIVAKRTAVTLAPLLCIVSDQSVCNQRKFPMFFFFFVCVCVCVCVWGGGGGGGVVLEYEYLLNTICWRLHAVTPGQ